MKRDEIEGQQEVELLEGALIRHLMSRRLLSVRTVAKELGVPARDVRVARADGVAGAEAVKVWLKALAAGEEEQTVE